MSSTHHDRAAPTTLKPLPSNPLYRWQERLALPLMVAPMTNVSTPALVRAVCTSGAACAIPTHNFTGSLSASLRMIDESFDGRHHAPWGVNLVVHASNPERDAHVRAIAQHGLEFVITSVGSPAPVIEPLHAAGVAVFCDVATMRHVERAIDAGVDGLIALTAGAGGQTGTLNPFAFVRTIRQIYDGPIVLAGGICDGATLAAATVAGADLAYMGTTFIAAEESGADNSYKTALITAQAHDVSQETRFTGLPANILVQSIPDEPTTARPTSFEQDDLLRHRDTLWGAGHGVGLIHAIEPAADLIARLTQEFRAAIDPSVPHSPGAGNTG